MPWGRFLQCKAKPILNSTKVRMTSFPFLVVGVFITKMKSHIVMSKDTMTVPKSKKSITLEKEIETKVRRIQARLIEKTDKNWSLSVVLNILVAAGLMQTKRMNRNEWQKIRTLIDNKEITFDESLISDFVKKLAI